MLKVVDESMSPGREGPSGKKPARAGWEGDGVPAVLQWAEPPRAGGVPSLGGYRSSMFKGIHAASQLLNGTP